MTLVSDIITDAFRLGNLIAVGTTPTADEQAEALRYLNRIIKSVFGNEVGDPLTPFPLGRVGITRPGDYPTWGNEPDGEWFVPKNVRLILNLDQSQTLYLHPTPDDGTRFAIHDRAGSLTSLPVTVDGNGRMIQGNSTLVLSTANYEAEWFYRADLADWVLVSPLAAGDTFPFPEEFEDFFVTMLAGRINPAYGAMMDEQAQQFLRRSKTQIRARYKQDQPVSPELATVLLPSQEKYFYYGADQPVFGDTPWRRWPW